MAHRDAPEILAALRDACSAASRLWCGEQKTRLYLSDRDGDCWIDVDADGDLIGHGPKMTRIEANRVWSPWERAAKSISRKLYA